MVAVQIIEDDLITRESLEFYINHHAGIELWNSAGSAEEAISQLQQEGRPDVLLLDIGLPGKSGLESIVQFQELHPDVDIIMFTTYEEEEKIFEALCAGACSYISKRTPLKQIMETILIVSNGGSYMSPSIARKISNHFSSRSKQKVEFSPSARQMEIIKCLVDGLSYKMIAAHLHISLDTVRSHIKKIYKLLKVNSSLEVVKKYNSGKIGTS